MKVTNFIPTIEGFLDLCHQPFIKAGHLSVEEIKKYCKAYGSGYPNMTLVENGHEMVALFSNNKETPPEFNKDEDKWDEFWNGHLKINVYHNNVE